MKARFGFIDPGTNCAVFDSNIRDDNWAKSVKSLEDNTEVTLDLKNLENRNAYQMKLKGEYNSGTSVQHLNEMKMYAELTGNCKKYEIKSSYGNIFGNNGRSCLINNSGSRCICILRNFN